MRQVHDHPQSQLKPFKIQPFQYLYCFTFIRSSSFQVQQNKDGKITQTPSSLSRWHIKLDKPQPSDLNDPR